MGSQTKELHNKTCQFSKIKDPMQNAALLKCSWCNVKLCKRWTKTPLETRCEKHTSERFLVLFSVLPLFPPSVWFPFREFYCFNVCSFTCPSGEMLSDYAFQVSNPSYIWLHGGAPCTVLFSFSLSASFTLISFNSPLPYPGFPYRFGPHLFATNPLTPNRTR